MGQRFVVRAIWASARVADKVWHKHYVSLDDVRHAATNPYIRASWHTHPQHGRRLRVLGRTPDGRLLEVWLEPSDEDGTWMLRTAYEVFE